MSEKGHRHSTKKAAIWFSTSPMPPPQIEFPDVLRTEAAQDVLDSAKCSPFFFAYPLALTVPQQTRRPPETLMQPVPRQLFGSTGAKMLFLPTVYVSVPYRSL